MSSLATLRGLADQAARVNAQMDVVVAELREFGATWADIGEAVGTSAQAAHGRWNPAAKARDRAAKTAIRERARRA